MTSAWSAGSVPKKLYAIRARVNEINPTTMNWKEEIQPYLDKHRIVGSGSTNDLLDHIQVQIIEKLIEDIPDAITGHCNQIAFTVSVHKAKQQLRDKWLWLN